MKPKIFIFVIFLVLLSITVSAVCVLNFDAETYNKGDTVTATMSCDSANEKNDAYSVGWYNCTAASGGLLETDIGTTPSTPGENFFESYTLPSDYVGTCVNASLIGGDLEGWDNASVATAVSSDLTITNCQVGGKWMKLTSSIDCDVYDVNSKLVSLGECTYSIWSNDETQMFDTGKTTMTYGDVKFSFNMDYDKYKENVQYRAKISCVCGAAGSGYACVNEDGTDVTGATGITSATFATNTWITFWNDSFPIVDVDNILINRTLYAGFDNVYWREVVENNYDEPVEVKFSMYTVTNATGRIWNEVPSVKKSLEAGNVTQVSTRPIPDTTPSGYHFIRVFYNIFYKGKEVAKYIRETIAFNILSIQGLLEIEGTSMTDYWGDIINTVNYTQDTTTLPSVNYTNTHYILAEGFPFTLCFNATNNDNDFYFYITDLELTNPSLDKTYIFLTPKDNWFTWIEGGSNRNICYTDYIPLNFISTHSDWHFRYTANIGEIDGYISCGDRCDFKGETEYFYTAKMEDAIEIPKWHTEPNATFKGNPGKFIMTERNEFLYMLNDAEYLTQSNISWGNSTFQCKDKNNNLTYLCDMSIYPTAGERIKLCVEAFNHLGGEEVYFILDNFRIDDDAVDTNHVLYQPPVNGYLKSMMDADLYSDVSISRLNEGDGNLLDGAATVCSGWMTLPLTIEGSNTWDMQWDMEVSPIYNFPDLIKWNEESDEFAIFGAARGDNVPRMLIGHGSEFTKDNATEGEYMQLSINLSNVHTYETIDSEISIYLLANANGNGGTVTIIPESYDESVELNVHNNHYDFSVIIPPSTNKIIETPKFKVPYGLKDSYEHDSIQANVKITILDELEQPIWKQTCSSNPTIEIINHKMEITNITTTASNTAAQACSVYTTTLTYDIPESDTGLTSEEDLHFILKASIEDTTNDYYLHSTILEINPDAGTNFQGSFTTTLPYISSSSIEAEMDIWIYTYDRTNTDPNCHHCGELIYQFSGDDGDATFNITYNGDESCRYSKSLDYTHSDDQMYLQWRSTVAAENFSVEISNATFSSTDFAYLRFLENLSIATTYLERQAVALEGINQSSIYLSYLTNQDYLQNLTYLQYQENLAELTNITTHLLNISQSQTYLSNLVFLNELNNLSYLNKLEYLNYLYQINDTLIREANALEGINNNTKFLNNLSLLQYLDNLAQMDNITSQLTRQADFLGGINTSSDYLSYLDNLPALQNLSYMSNLVELVYLNNLTDLTNLNELTYLSNLVELVYLNNLTNLEDLNNLLYLSNLTNLENLDYMSNLAELVFLQNLTELNNLNDLTYLTNLANLIYLTNLTNLENLDDMQYLSNLVELTALDNLSKLENLGELVNITTYMADISTDTNDLSYLNQLTNLSYLKYNEKLSFLTNLTRLDSLIYLSSLTNLSELPAQTIHLGSISTSLSGIDTDTNNLVYLSELTNLSYLNNLVYLDAMYNITNLLENGTSSWLRSAIALEGIENKTGVFHAAIDCPPVGYLREDMECTFTLQVENSQVEDIEIETNFICYINDSGVHYSTLEFMKEANSSEQTFTKSFYIPEQLDKYQQYQVSCRANYFVGLGSRSDPFSDTFIVKTKGSRVAERFEPEPTQIRIEKKAIPFLAIGLPIVGLLTSGGLFFFFRRRKLKISDDIYITDKKPILAGNKDEKDGEDFVRRF